MSKEGEQKVTLEQKIYYFFDRKLEIRTLDNIQALISEDPIEDIVKHYGNEKNRNSLNSPFLFIDMPPKCGYRDLFAKILETCDRRFYGRGRHEHEVSVFKLLEERRTEILVINHAQNLKRDSFQFLKRMGRRGEMQFIEGFDQDLKSYSLNQVLPVEIINGNKIHIVLLGPESLIPVLRKNDVICPIPGVCNLNCTVLKG